MTKPASALLIDDLELHVHLGWPNDEREERQLVHVDIDIWFAEPPKACISDHLDDTLCYSTLIDTIREKITNQHFHLIEHLTCEIYNIIKPLVANNSRVKVSIKKHPKIEGLAGHVRFSYWDDI